MLIGILKSIMSDQVLGAAINVLFAMMGVAFVFGILFRGLIYYTVKRHEWYSKEFEKRVHKYIDSQIPGRVNDVSFYALAKKLMERTYYEIFEVRDRMNRRKNDKLMRLSDRIFLIKQGCAWLVKDILKQLKFLKWTEDTPKLLNITKATFHHNPVFNRVFGIIPISGLNDVINILPGLFVIGGILGTFFGIVTGLPKLAEMKLDDIETTKNIMDGFLHEISGAMISSIMGIIFSVLMNIFNAIFSPERAFVSMVDRFESALDLLWYRSDNNRFPTNDPEFDEHKDPLDALAEQALNLEISRTTRTRDLEEIRTVKTG